VWGAGPFVREPETYTFLVLVGRRIQFGRNGRIEE
jgi:hypothetical protein